MRRRSAILALALAFAAPACDDDSPTSPTSGPIVFTADLRASNEVNPSVTNAESNAQGTATITFNVPRDSSGNITGAGTWNIQAVLSNFTNDSVLNLAHIHNAPAGQNAGVFVNSGLSAANPIRFPNGAATVNVESATITQAQAQAVVANPAGHYFNMHTTLNPSGAVRGQMVRVQ
jgi:CHRD domain